MNGKGSQYAINRQASKTYAFRAVIRASLLNPPFLSPSVNCLVFGSSGHATPYLNDIPLCGLRYLVSQMRKGWEYDNKEKKTSYILSCHIPIASRKISESEVSQ